MICTKCCRWTDGSDGSVLAAGMPWRWSGGGGSNHPSLVRGFTTLNFGVDPSRRPTPRRPLNGKWARSVTPNQPKLDRLDSRRPE